MDDFYEDCVVDYWWEDDFEVYNQNEADDYRNELDDYFDEDE